jgi:glycosyltransferase involved in cell wall biosynthesis
MSSTLIGRVSIVIPVHNEGAHVQDTVFAILDSSDQPFEVIIVDDGSTDGCCNDIAAPDRHRVRVVRQQRAGVAAARNRGAQEACGDVLIFLDAHCFPKQGCFERLSQAVASHPQSIIAPCLIDSADESLRGYGAKLTDRAFNYRWLPKRSSACYEIPIAGGACLAMKRDFFFGDLCAFDAMRTFGVEDVELCLRSWFFGFDVLLEPEAELAHVFRAKGNYSASWADYLHNALRTAVLHFSGQRLKRIVEDLELRSDFGEAARNLLLGDLCERHAFVRSRRRRDAQWFCDRFDISL